MLNGIKVVIDKLGAACWAALMIIGGAVIFVLIYPTTPIPDLLMYLAGCATTFLFGIGLTNTITRLVAKLKD